MAAHQGRHLVSTYAAAYVAGHGDAFADLRALGPELRARA
jgi:hypothetical protein